MDCFIRRCIESSLAEEESRRRRVYVLIYPEFLTHSVQIMTLDYIKALKTTEASKCWAFAVISAERNNRITSRLIEFLRDPG